MSVQLRSPNFSFVRFGAEEDYDTCYNDHVGFYLPVVLEDDVAFQVIAQCVSETDADYIFYTLGVTAFRIGLVHADDCEEAFEVEFTPTLKPTMKRIGKKEIMFYWPHGFPDFQDFFAVKQCFRIKIILSVSGGAIEACSNIFQRIEPDCYTSVLQYGSDQNSFGFNYCGLGSLFDEVTDGTCSPPTIIQFSGVDNLNIPYTFALAEKYGDVPTVSIFLKDPDNPTQFIQSVIRAGFVGNPPTAIIADLGGLADGFIKIS